MSFLASEYNKNNGLDLQKTQLSILLFIVFLGIIGIHVGIVTLIEKYVFNLFPVIKFDTIKNDKDKIRGATVFILLSIILPFTVSFAAGFLLNFIFK